MRRGDEPRSSWPGSKQARPFLLATAIPTCLPTGKLQLLISDFNPTFSVQDISSVIAYSLSVHGQD